MSAETRDTRRGWDAVVIGSGFGGAMVARPLIDAGLSVLMLERGDWVWRGPDNWNPSAAGLLTPHYSSESPYRVCSSQGEQKIGAFFNVGGPSVFYGGASFRYRENDFTPDPALIGDSRAAWPIGYTELEPWYAEAEGLLGVAGQAAADPTEPPRSGPYPGRASGLAPHSARLAEAALEMGQHPFPIPLAINRGQAPERPSCIACSTCDGFACAIGAKNDLAVGVIPELVRRGLSLWTNAVVRRVLQRRGRAIGVECVDRVSHQRFVVRADRVILAAGALATPHLLLGSGLARFNPAGHLIGRFLTRHLNTVVFGLFPHRVNPAQEFLKQLAILDHYAEGGAIQQIAAPPAAVVRTQVPWVMRPIASLLLSRLSGLLTIAEDQPRYHNRLELDPSCHDQFGLPQLVIRHRYSPRDLQRGGVLVQAARAILSRAGAVACYTHRIGTFSHALGTVRMGESPDSAPLDGSGRFRGVDQLWVSDGSTLPTAAAVNPSLTIAANALRIGAGIVDARNSEPTLRREAVHAAHDVAAG